MSRFGGILATALAGGAGAIQKQAGDDIEAQRRADLMRQQADIDLQFKQRLVEFGERQRRAGTLWDTTGEGGAAKLDLARRTGEQANDLAIKGRVAEATAPSWLQPRMPKPRPSFNATSGASTPRPSPKPKRLQPLRKRGRGWRPSTARLTRPCRARWPTWRRCLPPAIRWRPAPAVVTGEHGAMSTGRRRFTAARPTSVQRALVAFQAATALPSSARMVPIHSERLQVESHRPPCRQRNRS